MYGTLPPLSVYIFVVLTGIEVMSRLLSNPPSRLTQLSFTFVTGVSIGTAV